MRSICVLFVTLLLVNVSAQTPIPQPSYPNGMHVIVGPDGSIPRNAPWGTCGTDNHACGAGDTQPPGVYGVVQPDAPTLDTGGLFYWIRVRYDAPTTTGIQTGWSRSIMPYLGMLTPPQMISGISFSVAADYHGPILTNAICINDGANSAATMNLQSATCCSDNGPGQKGTLVCPWPKAGLGNHKVVIQAVNSMGTAQSSEFQFVVTTSPQLVPPTVPSVVQIK